jgi:hypothetical protein
MGSRLIPHRFDERHVLVNPGNRYYLVTDLAKSSGITVKAEKMTQKVSNSVHMYSSSQRPSGKSKLPWTAKEL